MADEPKKTGFIDGLLAALDGFAMDDSAFETGDAPEINTQLDNPPDTGDDDGTIPDESIDLGADESDEDEPFDDSVDLGSDSDED